MSETKPEAEPHESIPNAWWIPCSVCTKSFVFDLKEHTEFYKAVPAGVRHYVETCRNKNPNNENKPCETVYIIEYNHDDRKIKTFYKSPNPNHDLFWLEIGRDLVKGSIETLDKRAEYMITTITALIVIDFGILVAFQVQQYTWKIGPQVLLAVSAFWFFYSLHIKKYEVQLQSPDNIELVYQDIGSRKHKRQNIGFYIFIAALLFMAVTYVLEPPKQPEDPTRIILEGKLQISPP